MDFAECPNCSKAIKGGFLNPNRIVTVHTDYINKVRGTAVAAHCDSCSQNTYYKAREELRQKQPVAKAAVDVLTERLQHALSSVPLLSLHYPRGWKFEPITIVTAQSVTGTGLFSEVGSTFADMFGLQSNQFRDKLRGGENLCKASIRRDAIELGAHAVIGIDVDYAEVGGAKSMLMVCMTGTAVRLRNLEVLPEGAPTDIESALEILEEFRRRRAAT